MTKIKKNYPLSDLEVVDISAEGKAVAKHDGMVVFIEGAVPGDKVDVMVMRQKKNFAEARLERLVTPSPNRATPVCEHFGTCGGCKWQNLDYATQLKFKEKFVVDALTRIGKLQLPPITPIIGSDAPYYYRNKLEFSFSNKRWLSPAEMMSNEAVTVRDALGFHIPGMFDKVLAINNCYLQPLPSNDIRNAVRDYAQKKGLSFYDIRNKSGFLRTLMIRTSLTGEAMVVVSVFEFLKDELFSLLDFLKDSFPQITSLQYVHNNKGNDSLDGLTLQTYHGKDHILEEMEGLRFMISAKSFYQTNPAQAYKLYCITRDFAGVKKNDVVYDLYTGTGSIANFVARQARSVIGLEYIEEAVRDARENSKANNIDNTIFYAGDMKDLLQPSLFEKHGKPDVIITDPPRAGMHEDVVKNIVASAAPKVVYVSCNPATQARDLALMAEQYDIAKVQPVDMFPQTSHVENVILLTRK